MLVSFDFLAMASNCQKSEWGVTTMRPNLSLAACIGGLLLLCVVVPLVPQRTGLPRFRVVEMGLFWLGQSLVIYGSGAALRAAAATNPANQPGPSRTAMLLASVGVLIATLTCLLALTNLLATSLQGAGLQSAGLRPGRLYPKELGYALALPLLTAVALQIPLAWVPKGVAWPPLPLAHTSTARMLGFSLLAILFVGFAGSCLLFLIDRWFALVSVAATWTAGSVFVLLAASQLLGVIGRPDHGVH